MGKCSKPKLCQRAIFRNLTATTKTAETKQMNKQANKQKGTWGREIFEENVHFRNVYKIQII